MNYVILMEKANCLSKLLKDSQILNELKLMEAVVGIIGNLGEEISRLHSSHYGPFCYIANWTLVNIQIVFSNISAF